MSRRPKATLLTLNKREWAELHRESKRTGRNMSSLMAAAWEIAKDRIRAMPSFRSQLRTEDVHESP